MKDYNSENPEAYTKPDPANYKICIVVVHFGTKGDISGYKDVKKNLAVSIYDILISKLTGNYFPRKLWLEVNPKNKVQCCKYMEVISQ